MKTKIVVDYDKCKDPRICKKCLQICPPAIFILYSPDYINNDPTDWRVDVAFTDLCTRCNQCVDICPLDAITIK
ncbi:MAG: ferredoxin [Candidatus Thorarchaeota archaeon]|nr:MAG: ferredoxin [Candidatus Thorarchaeota archaeon]